MGDDYALLLLLLGSLYSHIESSASSSSYSSTTSGVECFLSTQLRLCKEIDPLPHPTTFQSLLSFPFVCLCSLFICINQSLSVYKRCCFSSGIVLLGMIVMLTSLAFLCSTRPNILVLLYFFKRLAKQSQHSRGVCTWCTSRQRSNS